MKARLAVAAVSIFVLGAVAGVVVDRWHRASSGGGPDHGVRHTMEAERALEHLRSELHLDDAQVSTLDSVVREHQVYVDRVWAEARPEIQEAVDSVHAYIESILRPDQREAFRRLLHPEADPARPDSF